MVLIRNILVPTDFSDCASTALEYAKALAAQFGSRVHLLHVIATPQLVSGPEGVAFVWPTFLPDLEKGAHDELERLAKTVTTAGASTAVAVGIPVDGILDYVAANDVDLVVMGTHGRGMMGHLLLGSVAERVIRRSPVPVLTLHAAAIGTAKAVEEVMAAHAAAVAAS